ncbi:NCS1 nucleoside transporter family [Mycena belliarum]|uniref:NCS1 nucleoside transporter family n=1 Tax=Mycena belliarum TaxID=1033014 RepID=A0AAD6XMI4_9AGAR|nr:NCS1 nucleoside transporter family [Mycena belliae]
MPLPHSRRTWGAWDFVGFWFVLGVNISGWTTASSLLALGLNVWQAMLAVIIGNTIVGFAVALSGLPGGDWQIGFPIINRSVWGMYGSFFPLLMRIILSFVWYGVQTWFGGKSMKVVIGALWPGFISMENTLPESAAMKTNDCIAMMIFWILSLPLLAIPPEYYKIPFRCVTIFSSVTMFSVFVWALAKERGGGPLISQPTMLLGAAEPSVPSELAWRFILGITTIIGSICAGILNQSDFTRFARKPGVQILPQIFCAPIMSVLTAAIGLVTTSCAAGFYPGEALLWQPYDLLIAIQTHEGNSARAATFFAGCAFVVSQMGVNVSVNGISGGIDLAGVFPRYLNIRRGAYITAVVGLAVNPWQLLNTANTFITVLSSFAVFLGPASGLMAADYVIIRQRKLKLSHLYKASSVSIYWYTAGFNSRAFIAWVMGVWPLMPGFVAAIQRRMVPMGWLHVCDLAWLFGFVVSGTTYVILCKIWPPHGLQIVDTDSDTGIFGNIPTRRQAVGANARVQCGRVEVHDAL